MDTKSVNWAALARNPKFVELHHKKTAFLFGWWAFSSVYYFLLPIGAAYAPGLFKVKILGNINFGYLFALSQFFVSWGIAIYYSKVANQKFDRMTRELVDEISR